MRPRKRSAMRAAPAQLLTEQKKLLALFGREEK